MTFVYTTVIFADRRKRRCHGFMKDEELFFYVGVMLTTLTFHPWLADDQDKVRLVFLLLAERAFGKGYSSNHFENNFTEIRGMRRLLLTDSIFECNTTSLLAQVISKKILSKLFSASKSGVVRCKVSVVLS